MDKRKGMRNVCVSVAFKIATVIMVVLVKRALIGCCGNDINGLNALYLSIIGFLSVAELGIGGAITYCMYRPIVNGEKQKTAALYSLFRKVYLGVGFTVLAVGLIITPFVKYFARDYAELDVDLYVNFILMLISVVLTYFFGAKTALINAHKNNYITTAISSCGLLLQYIMQISVLMLTASFTWYLVCRIITALLQWMVTHLVARRDHSDILSIRSQVDPDTKKELSKSIRAMFMHKVGYLLTNTIDSMVIAAFIGVSVLGEYSNYYTIMTSVTGILVLVFSSLTSVVGHFCAKEDKKTAREYSEYFHLLNFLIGVVFFLGYYAIIDDLITLLFSAELVVSRMISATITLSGFVQFMRQSTLMFRDATGTFYNDRYKPLAEGVVNLVLSVLFVNFMGVTGVIVATILTNLLICHVVEPYVLYKNAFGAFPVRYYLYNYTMIALFGAALCVLNFVMISAESVYVQLFTNGCISVLVSAGAAVIIMLCRANICISLQKKIKRRKKT